MSALAEAGARARAVLRRVRRAPVRDPRRTGRGPRRSRPRGARPRGRARGRSSLSLRASFAPLLDPAEAGNGVHIHVDLLDRDGGARCCTTPLAPARSASSAARFAAGILRHARALSALSAASPGVRRSACSRTAGARARCAWRLRNREALLRIPPLIALGGAEPARQMRLEYRGADASANPYLALGALLRAGLAGVRDELPAPAAARGRPRDARRRARRALRRRRAAGVAR